VSTSAPLRSGALEVSIQDATGALSPVLFTVPRKLCRMDVSYRRNPRLPSSLQAKNIHRFTETNCEQQLLRLGGC